MTSIVQEFAMPSEDWMTVSIRIPSHDSESMQAASCCKISADGFEMVKIGINDGCTQNLMNIIHYPYQFIELTNIRFFCMFAIFLLLSSSHEVIGSHS